MNLHILSAFIVLFLSVQFSYSHDYSNGLEDRATETFVFLLPPTSFAYGQITLGLELYKRGHRIIFATLDGLQKHFDQQYHSLQINENEQRNLIEPEVISFGPHQEWGNKTLMRLASSDPTYFIKDPAAGQQAFIYYSTQFQTITEGIDKQQDRLGLSHPLYSHDSLYIVPGVFTVAVDYLLLRDQPFALVLPSAAASFIITSPVFSPIPFSKIPSFNKTFQERLQCLFPSFMQNIVFGRFISFPSPMMDARNLFTKPVLKLITSIPPLAPLKPYSPLTVFTGPLVNKERVHFNLLDPHIQQILSGSLPVVYVSFGTYADLGAPQLDFITNSVFPTDKKWSVVWSLKDDQKEGMSSNTVARIKSSDGLFSIVPWTNTPSILNHHNTILFVSHCGGNGINEAVALGKPVIGFPLFGDQQANCLSARENIQSAVCHSFLTSKPREIYDLIDDIISNPQNHSMIVNAKKAQILSTSAYRGVETAANWLEAAAALKGDVRMLETPVEREGVIKSYCLDILIGASLMIFLAGVIVGISWMLYSSKQGPDTLTSWLQRHVPAALLLTWGCRVRTCWMWCRRRLPHRAD